MTIISNVLFIIIGIVLLIMCVRELIQSNKWYKKIEIQHAKIMADTKARYKLNMIIAALDDANLTVYETPSGKYIIIPRED